MQNDIVGNEKHSGRSSSSPVWRENRHHHAHHNFGPSNSHMDVQNSGHSYDFLFPDAYNNLMKHQQYDRSYLQNNVKRQSPFPQFIPSTTTTPFQPQWQFNTPFPSAFQSTPQTGFNFVPQQQFHQQQQQPNFNQQQPQQFNSQQQQQQPKQFQPQQQSSQKIQPTQQSQSQNGPQQIPNTPQSQPPQYYQCMNRCLSTNEYNPVCGSDGVTYSNRSRLQCASRCGTSE